MEVLRINPVKTLALLSTSLIVLLFMPLDVNGQDYSKLSFDLVKILNSPGALNKSNQHTLTVILKGETEALIDFVINNEGVVKYHVADFLAINLPVNKLKSLSEFAFLIKAESCSGPLFFNDRVALSQTMADTVHAGGLELQKPYSGNGVIFGIIDSGIDPSHTDFQNDDGSTRILAFWDQNDTSSKLDPYGYGKGYTHQEINSGAMLNYLDTTFGGHGTAVAGVAVGGGRAHPDVIGMAPDADIVAVGINPNILDYLNRNPSMLNIVDGIDYIFKYAESVNKPAVINISLGGIEGSHDGRDLPTQMIDAMLEARHGRALVTSAGNSALTRHHIQFNVNGDTLFTWFESMYANTQVCKRDSAAYMSFYGDSSDVANLWISIAAENRSPCCQVIDETDFQPFLNSVGTIKTDTLWDDSNPIGIVHTFVEKMEGAYAYFMEIESTNMNVLWRFSVTGKGKIDGWAGPLNRRSCNSTYILNPSSVGTSSQIINFNGYVAPDNDQTIGTAYACSKNVVTVGAHYVRNSMLDIDSLRRSYSVSPYRRATFSSRGPSRDERIKPEIIAPGSRIITTQASQVLAGKAASARSTLYLGGQHAITDGTSFASPAVAGVVALYFEKYPEATYKDVINAIIKSADTELFMGSLPNNSYGYGRINAYEMLLVPPTPIQKMDSLIYMDALIYPNPSEGTIMIKLSESSGKNFDVEIFDLIGQKIYQKNHSAHSFSINMNQTGMYILRIRNEVGDTYSERLMAL